MMYGHVDKFHDLDSCFRFLISIQNEIYIFDSIHIYRANGMIGCYYVIKDDVERKVLDETSSHESEV